MISSDVFKGRNFVLASIALLVAAGLVIGSVWLLTATQYSAIASAVQAVAVVPAVVVAALTLTRDSRDKRVDRVLDLHREFNSTEINEARTRLAAHLRSNGDGGRIRPTTYEELGHDPVLSRYASAAENTPRGDANKVLRFFERANAARIAKSVDPPMFVELICRHATWWNQAIAGSVDQVPRAPLMELATWADDFAFANKARYYFLRNWGQNRRKEFGSSALAPDAAIGSGVGSPVEGDGT